MATRRNTTAQTTVPQTVTVFAKSMMAGDIYTSQKGNVVQRIYVTYDLPDEQGNVSTQTNFITKPVVMTEQLVGKKGVALEVDLADERQGYNIRLLGYDMGVTL